MENIAAFNKDPAWEVKTLSDIEFRRVCSLVHDNFGISLSSKKRKMVEVRLSKMLRILKIGSFNDFFEQEQRNNDGTMLSHLANFLTINHTYFNREPAQFNYLTGTVLPEIIARRRAGNTLDLRVWCAGCSTGEEPYTLVMLMMEALGLEYAKWDAGILATDLDTNVIESAKIGVYQSEGLEKLSKLFQRKYFKKTKEGLHEVIPDLKRQVTYRRFNLMSTHFPFKKQFHIIFCRNVMIYFNRETRSELVQKYYRHTSPGGYLFIGLTETIRDFDTSYEYIRPGVYRRRLE